MLGLGLLVTMLFSLGMASSWLYCWLEQLAHEGIMPSSQNEDKLPVVRG